MPGRRYSAQGDVSISRILVEPNNPLSRATLAHVSHCHTSAGVALLGATGRAGANAREIGYWIHVDHIGHGYATEAVAALTRAGFEIDHVQRIDIRWPWAMSAAPMCRASSRTRTRRHCAGVTPHRTARCAT
ncbi:MAG: GNAT family N-acetyltransferase [Candidatus Roseilinea sp.]|uniref:GNAT family N-acetyltransferase n=1 Tax=Candidatus Roseilinea sp. TaxID=2838777 RepID=UPI004049AE25